MNTIKFIYLLISLIMLSIFTINCEDKTKILAKVDKEIISKQDFQDFIKLRFQGAQISEFSYEYRKKIINQMIENRKKALYAKELGYHKRDEFIRDRSFQHDYLSAVKLTDLEIVEKYVTPDMIRAVFDLQNNKRKIMMIILGFNESLKFKAERTKSETTELANQILQEIKPENFSKLSSQYSDDPRLKEQGGIIGSYMPGSFDPELDVSIAKSPQRELIGPVTTENGIFIFQIIEIQKSDSKTDFDLEKDNIKMQLFNSFYRSKGNKDFPRISKQFKEKLGSKISEEGIDEFLASIEELKNSGKLQSDSSFSDKQRSIVLGYLGDFQITGGYFIDLHRGNFLNSYRTFSNKNKLKGVLQNYIDKNLCWILIAKERKINDQPDVLNELKKFEETRLNTLLESKLVTNKANTSEDENRKFYEKNLEKYQDPRQIRIWEIALKDEKTAVNIYNEALRNKEKFGELAQKHTFKNGLKKRQGDIGYQIDKSKRIIVQEAFKVGADQIIGPIKEQNYFYVIKTGDIKPARQKSYDEVKQLVKTDAKKDKENQIRTTLLQKINQKYNHWINDTLLKNL